jgi:uncharacterized protein (TIGR02453 family)
MTDSPSRFTRDTFAVLAELAANNNRQWFMDNKGRYEDEVRAPALGLIEAMAPKLVAISRHFVTSGKRSGGSLMRVYRDMRYSRDKTPYKTNIGIQFRHALGRDAHAPGYYVHISAERCFVGAGVWRPDPVALAKIRRAIDDHARAWKKMRDDAAFQQAFYLSGSVLKRPPRGYDRDHPLIDDLKRKDFIGISEASNDDVLREGFVDNVAGRFASASPFMRFLCRALGVGF